VLDVYTLVSYRSLFLEKLRAVTLKFWPSFSTSKSVLGLSSVLLEEAMRVHHLQSHQSLCLVWLCLDYFAQQLKQLGLIQRITTLQTAEQLSPRGSLGQGQAADASAASAS
jgi:hypothetical protein